jgi:hypothetical protein
MKRLYFFIITFLLLLIQNNIFAISKYEKWQNGSYFRGYNVLYESPKTLQDFIDFKNYGGNLFVIGTDGFMDEDPPYSVQQQNIDGTDMLVGFCRQAGIYYVIALRSGPGAYDTYDESQGWTGESRIWNSDNFAEQQLYAEMLKMVTARYADDSLFAGINLVVEPRPKVRFVPANTSSLYKWFLENVYNIHMDEVYNFWISEIRSISPDLPVLVENFAYSTPELFPSYELADSFIIYSTHNYQPKEYTNASEPFSVTYPGTYWNLTYLAQVLYDAAFMRNTVFAKVRDFQNTTGKPVLLGEFGMLLPQNGGDVYINDVLTICKDYDWHFALWDWRRGSGQNWNIEAFEEDEHNHWVSVLKNFHAPPVPDLLTPENGSVLLTFTPLLTWDSLTAFTKYDVMLQQVDDLRNRIRYDFTNARWLYDGNTLERSKHYQWQVRSKNPGGQAENWSEWSEPFYFYVPEIHDRVTGNERPDKFKLKQNYPNPFNPVTDIPFSLPENSNVKIVVYDIIGREVKTLLEGFNNAGNYTISFRSDGLATGVYLYKMTAVSTESGKTFSDMKKLIITK